MNTSCRNDSFYNNQTQRRLWLQQHELKSATSSNWIMEFHFDFYVSKLFPTLFIAPRVWWRAEMPKRDEEIKPSDSWRPRKGRKIIYWVLSNFISENIIVGRMKIHISEGGEKLSRGSPLRWRRGFSTFLWEKLREWLYGRKQYINQYKKLLTIKEAAKKRGASKRVKGEKINWRRRINYKLKARFS